MSRNPVNSNRNGDEPSAMDLPLIDGLLQLWRIAWRRNLLILLGVVISLALAALFCSLVSPSYYSEAQLLVEREGPRGLPTPGVEPQMAILHDSLSGHEALLNSRLIAKLAIERSELTALASFSNEQEKATEEKASLFSLGKLFGWIPSFGRSTKPHPFDPTDIIKRGLFVSRQVKDASLQDPSVAIYNITYACKDEDDCRAILEAVIDGYTAYVDDTYRSDNEQIRSLFVKWQGDLQQELAAKRAAYRELLDEIQPLQWRSEGGINLSEKRVADIDDQRLAMLVELAQDSERLRSLEKAREEGVNHQVLFEMVSTWTRSADEHTTARDQLFELLLEEKRLVKIFGSLHREVAAIRDQIKTVARQVFGPLADTEDLELIDPVEVYMQSLRRNVEVTRVTAQKLEELIEVEHSKVKDAHALNEDLVDLRADEDLFRSLQEQVVNQLQSVDVAKESEFLETHILAPPSLGKLTVLSRPTVVFMLFGFFGLLLGGGFAMLAEALNRSYRTPQDLARRMHLPVLGHIPYSRRRMATAGKSEGSAQLNSLLVAYHRPDSADAEAYRGLRNALCYRAGADGLKVIQITSPRSGDGKSVLAANLAVSIAQTGKRVLLIEADFRSPRLAPIFGVSNEVGLANLLSGDAEEKDVVQPSGVAGLNVLTCGSLSSNPGELLTSPRFQQQLKSLGEPYDLVLIDTPPLLAVSDPSAVAAHVDGVLLMMCNSRNAQTVTSRALERLDAVGARALGVVVRGKRRWFGPQRYGYDQSSMKLDDYQAYQPNSSNDRRVARVSPVSHEN